MKQETLEEAAERYCTPIFYMGTPKQDLKRGFELGAKWHQERSYSEEDIKLAFESGVRNVVKLIGKYQVESKISADEWFEQFKKK